MWTLVWVARVRSMIAACSSGSISNRIAAPGTRPRRAGGGRSGVPVPPGHRPGPRARSPAGGRPGRRIPPRSRAVRRASGCSPRTARATGTTAGAAREPCGVRLVQLPGQRLHRQAVCADVVEGEQQDVLFGSGGEQPGAQRDVAGQVEGGEGGLADRGREVRRVLDRQARADGGGGQDDLAGRPVLFGVDGAQHLVAVGEVTEGRLQGGRVEPAADADGDGQDVRRRGPSSRWWNHMRYWEGERGTTSGRAAGPRAGRAAGADPMASARAATVGLPKTAATPRSTPRTVRIRLIRRIACSELPPRRKKSSWTPARGRPRASANSRQSTSSRSLRAPCPACASAVGVGRAR